MNLDQIRCDLAEISRLARLGDDEAAHNREDRLHDDFIWYVARNGSPELQVLANAVLASKSISFPRYTA